VSPDFQFVTIVWSSWRDLLTLKPGKTQTGVPKLAGRQQQSTTMRWPSEWILAVMCCARRLLATWCYLSLEY
jgi:hypothetical protein